jgi:hypothetical protein
MAIHSRLSVEEMQRRFNRAKYWERMQAGEFQEVILRRSPNIAHPGVLQRHPDASSITSRYRDKHGNDIVEIHYYALPDGSVIPGKRPDPKLLFEDGVWYHMEKAKDRIKRLEAEAMQPFWHRAWRRICAMMIP